MPGVRSMLRSVEPVARLTVPVVGGLGADTSTRTLCAVGAATAEVFLLVLPSAPCAVHAYEPLPRLLRSSVAVHGQFGAATHVGTTTVPVELLVPAVPSG